MCEDPGWDRCLKRMASFSPMTSSEVGTVKCGHEAAEDMLKAAALDLEAWWPPNTVEADTVLCCVALGKSLPLSDKQKQSRYQRAPGSPGATHCGVPIPTGSRAERVWTFKGA